jgi:ribonuclease-3
MSDAEPALRNAAAQPEQLTRLQDRLGHRFEDPTLLVRALTHRSYANEQGTGADNEVLEFLGDAVLGLIVSDLLCSEHPDLSEGQMSKLKSYLVSAETLGRLADEFGLGSYILLGRGEEKTEGRNKSSILANAFEAVIASLYTDGGLTKARNFVLDLVGPLLEEAEDEPGGATVRDFKSTLQEHVQAEGLPLPEYLVVEEEGPDHAKIFHVEVRVGPAGSSRGTGRTKKRAEQRAARELLRALKSQPGE